MTTPEQQAREMLGEATSSDLPVLVADIIAERNALKAELAAIKGAGEPSTRPAVPLTDEHIEALKRLLFAAQTTGGTAGRDEELCAAIEAAKDAFGIKGA